MIIIRTYLEDNVKYVDYGIDSDTLTNVCLPPERFSDWIRNGYVRKSVELNEWVLTGYFQIEEQTP